MAAATPQFVLVKTASPRGIFGRAGLRFTREWRPLRIADKADLEAGVIDADVLARLEAETEMLAVKPASEAEVAQFMSAQAAGSIDPVTELAEMKVRNADLEGRLMRLEFSAGKGSGPAPESGEVADLRAKNADLEARLARLESAKPASESATAATAPAAAPGAPAPAGDKKSVKG